MGHLSAHAYIVTGSKSGAHKCLPSLMDYSRHIGVYVHVVNMGGHI